MQKAAKRPKSTHKQKPISKSKRMDKAILGVILAVLVIGFTFYLWAVVFDGMYTDEKSKMENYLRDKYRKQFEVDDLEGHSCGLGCKGTISAKAYPIENPEYEFSVVSSSKGVMDYYPSALWSQEEQAILPGYIVNHAMNSKFKVTVNGTNELLNAQGPDVPTFAEVASKNAESVSYFINIERDDGSDSVEDADRELFINVSRYINEKKVGTRIITYTIRKSEKSFLRCNISIEDSKPIQATDEEINKCFMEFRN